MLNFLRSTPNGEPTTHLWQFLTLSCVVCIYCIIFHSIVMMWTYSKMIHNREICTYFLGTQSIFSKILTKDNVWNWIQFRGQLKLQKDAIYITLKHERLLCVQGLNYFPPVSLFWLMQYHVPLCCVINALSRYIISNHGIAMAYTHSLCSNYSVLTHLPIGVMLLILECDFWTHVMDWVHRYFLWNCSLVNNKEYHWW